MTPDSLFDSSPVVLAEGAVIERLRRNPSLKLDQSLMNAPLIYDPAGREEMRLIYSEYIRAGLEADLPLLLAAPTWRVNPERLAGSDYPGRELIEDAVGFMTGLRDSFGDYAAKIMIGGLMSCRGDSYDPDQALGEAEAYDFHSWQARALAASAVDYLHAATLPALSEAIGLARALAETGKSYLISFVVRPGGTLLDGVMIHEAVETIDRLVEPRPWLYMVNCVHPSILGRALSAQPPWVLSRLVGLQGNTSALSPEELDGAAQTNSQPPLDFARAMFELHRVYGLKILGGCCGTNAGHIRALAELMSGKKFENNVVN